MSERLISTSETARRLGVSRQTVYELLNRGELASLTVGRSRRIPEAEVDRYVAARMAAERPASRLDAYVREVVDRAPELTPEQVRQLAGLVAGGEAA